MPASAAGLRAQLAAPLAEAGLDLEDVHVRRAGRRELVRVVVDRDGGVDLDAIAEASHLISGLLDSEPLAREFDGAYVLEVTSPGVDRPLTEPRHWRRAAGRLVHATLADGSVLSGRVIGADDVNVVMRLADGSQTSVEYGALRHGSVQVEFQRTEEAQGDGGDESDVDESDPDKEVPWTST
jgi:ribosome maturation factor RimP